MGKVDRLTIDSATVSMAGQQTASGPAIANALLCLRKRWRTRARVA